MDHGKWKREKLDKGGPIPVTCGKIYKVEIVLAK
jgi:hypothetical protein